MRLASGAIVLLSILSQVAFGQQPPTQPVAPVTDEAFDAALEQAASAEPGSEPFVAALQSVASRFATVEAALEPDAGVWRSVALNTRGKRVDAFRFRVPEGERRDLYWALAFAPGLDRWYIAPVEGVAGQGFRSFLKAPPAKLFKGKAPEGVSGIVQSLPGQHLEPGREYMIWFTFKDEKPATVLVAMALLPAKGRPNDNGAYRALGLPLPVAEDAQPASQ